MENLLQVGDMDKIIGKKVAGQRLPETDQVESYQAKNHQQGILAERSQPRDKRQWLRACVDSVSRSQLIEGRL